DNDAEIAKYWHPNKNGVKQPEDYSVGSKKQAWWVCEYGHEWNTKINNMTVRRRKTICPICKNKKLTERK
nr:hypothetical protein [Rhodospirillales bacterium]